MRKKGITIVHVDKELLFDVLSIAIFDISLTAVAMDNKEFISMAVAYGCKSFLSLLQPSLVKKFRLRHCLYGIYFKIEFQYIDRYSFSGVEPGSSVDLVHP